MDICFLKKIVSQGCCESRQTIYDQRAKSVLSVVLNFLIKKELMVTNEMVVRVHVLATLQGALLGTMGKTKKAMYNGEIKTKI